MKGELPKEKKLIVAVAPHTSNWDFIIAMSGTLAVGIKLSYFMKKEAFFFPFAGLFKRLGGIPIDRSNPKGMVAGVVDEFNNKEKLWVVVTPEGTRSRVSEYKTGFLRMAQLSCVPVYIISLNFPTKQIILDRIWKTTENLDQDAADIRDYINKHFVGRHPENQ